MTEYIYGTDDREGHWLTGEEIVRCRDCKWYDTTGPWCYEPSKTYIDEYGLEVCATVKPDGFCAWGERKEVDE